MPATMEYEFTGDWWPTKLQRSAVGTDSSGKKKIGNSGGLKDLEIPVFTTCSQLQK